MADSAPLPDGVRAATLLEDSAERFFRVGGELGVGSFGINQILLQPGHRNRIHRHGRQEEVYVVLSGVLSVAIEGEEHDFTAGSVVYLAPHVRRQLGNRGPGILSLIALGGLSDHEHEPRDGEPFGDWSATEPTPREQITGPPEDYPADEQRS